MTRHFMFGMKSDNVKKIPFSNKNFLEEGKNIMQKIIQ